MADENKPAFYPRVGNIRSKNFVPAKPMPFVEDPRAMDLPQYGDVDLSVPSKENLELSRRMAERDAQLKRQQEADRSIPEKLAGGIQAGRFLGSALTQGINSIPTRLAYGDKAAEKFMEDRIYKPEQPLAYEYAQDVGDFLEKLETEYKIPPLMPEALPLQFLSGPATAQAARAAGKGAVKAGMALERSMEPVVKGALERGGLPREMVMAMGANTQSNVMKPSNKANWMSGPSIHVPEGDAWRFKTPTVAGETPAQRIPYHEELLNDPTLNLDQLDRVKYQLELTKGEAALDKWADNALMGYFKGQLASPEDPVRLMIEKNYANIEAKFAKDQERAARMAQRAETEPDPRRQGNMKRQANTMMAQARDDRDMAMQNISHLPPEMLRDIELDPKSYIKEERVKAGYPAEGLGTTDPSRKWEHQADEAVKVTRAGDIQGAMDLQPRLDQALQEQLVVYQKLNKEWGDLLRSKGLQEKDIDALMTSMPRNTKAEAVGMLDELQKADSNYLRLLDQDRSFPKFAAQDNPFVAKLDPETKMYSGYMGDLGFEHVMDVLRQDVAAGRLRSDQLNKLSLEQAVKRTQEYNLERAKTMRDAKLIQQEGFTTYKDYPDQGYKWIELAVPEPLLPENYKILPDITNYKNPGKELYSIVDGNGNVLSTGATEAEAKKLFKRKEREQQLADALKYEGDTMGHCVGGYCPDVISGKSKIYSLRDAKGEPHVTIEAMPNHPQWSKVENAFGKEKASELFTEFKTINPSYGSQSTAKIADIFNEFLTTKGLEPIDYGFDIVQIKGKQNAKPKDDYIPFVQDFVKSGNWSVVGDFKNTDLISADQVRKAGWDMSGNTQKYFTKQEYDDLVNKEQKKVENFGMKAGGKVSISNNPDTMMMELGNKRMKEGGSEDDTKPYFGGAGTKKYAAAKKRAEQDDVNTLKDPRTYATVAGFMGERPDEMGFSVLHPDYQGVKEAADPAFYAGTALGVAPLMRVFKAPAMALGRAGEKYAEKVVPQIMERGGVGADMLGGLAQGTRSYAYLPHTEKSPNPLVGSRYKTQYVGNLTPKYDFNIQAEQGSSVMSNPWDLTSRGEKVLEVSDIPMSNQMVTEGGHDFARDLANIKANIGGASGRQIAERMQDRVNDATFANLFDKGTGRVFTMPSTMDVKGSHFSTMPTDLVMDIFQQAGLKPKDVDRITDDLRTFVFETEKGKFRNAAPVGSPEFMLQLRQGGKGFSAGDLRKGLMDRMSKSEYQKMLGYNIEDVYGAIGDQSLKGLPKGFVGNTMIETSPFAGLKPATHQSYDTANMGKYAGSMPSMPLELMMPDLFRSLEINYLKNPKYQKLTPLQLRTMIVNTIEKRGNVISQPINQRVVDNVMRYKQGLAQGHFQPNDYDSIMEFMRRTGGYKDGGAVHKAEGGEVTGDDLILEERPL